MTENKFKVTYRHPRKEGAILEVAGILESELNAETLLIRRLDGVLVDIPQVNVIKAEQLS